MRDRPAPDVLAALLRHVRISAVVFGRVELGAPWAARLPARDTVSLHHVLEGSLWLPEAGAQVQVGPGDLLMLPHGTPCTLRHAPGGAGDDRGLVVAPPAAQDTLSVFRRLGGDGPRTVVLCAELTVAGAARDRLIRALPRVVHFPATGTPTTAGAAVPGLTALLDLLRDELRQPGPGAATIAARLAELLLLQAIRGAATRPAEPGSWRAALADDRIARALDAAYAEPHRPWTLHALARVAGMGRTAFTARFRELVGESPFAHLTRWRMDLAATMLRDEPGRTLAEVAAAVGYSDEFAFGAAFRREVGTPPGTYRTPG
ncbi:AraC family transcriptional regulator [Dactylosporangium cerinum]|uniref:AraC family transcriptional regulator n=1 Tax=Dactylosporangium cerinum TaxID=1434730 RepID=A0ABV9VYN1_9ACTN